MRRNLSIGIDIGTRQIKVLVAETQQRNGRVVPRVIGSGYAESKGLRHGYIINSIDVSRSIEQAVAQAEESSGVKIKRAYISIGGIGLNGNISQASTMISRADSEITDLDMEKALEACEAAVPPTQALNRKIIHAIPIQYKIDGKPVLGKPLGMKGMKLEGRVLFVTALEQHLNDLIEAVEEAGVEVLDVFAAPIAASLVTLNKTQKIAGCVLANIGAETLSIVVYENNIPISLEVFPIGSTDITNDIALGLKVSLEEAEQIKHGVVTSTIYPRKQLEEIISARLSDMFELIEAHLKKIGRNKLLPAGIVITGGGSGIQAVEDMAKSTLNLPSRIATINIKENGTSQFKDSSWSVAYGLCILGLNADEGSSFGVKHMARKTRGKILGFIKQFLP